MCANFLFWAGSRWKCLLRLECERETDREREGLGIYHIWVSSSGNHCEGHINMSALIRDEHVVFTQGVASNVHLCVGVYIPVAQVKFIFIFYCNALMV